MLGFDMLAKQARYAFATLRTPKAHSSLRGTPAARLDMSLLCSDDISNSQPAPRVDFIQVLLGFHLPFIRQRRISLQAVLALPLHRATRAAAAAGATAAAFFLFANGKKYYHSNHRAKHQKHADGCNVIFQKFNKTHRYAPLLKISS